MSLAELRALAAESYDGVRQKVWTEPDPAAGADFTITVPGPQFWLPVALTGILTTSDTDASRDPVLTITDGTTIVASVGSTETIGPSTAGRFTFLRTWPIVNSDSATAVFTSPLPDVTLPTGWTIAITTDNIDDADQWTSIALTAIQITGGQPAQRGRRETAIREHVHALYELSEGR